MYLTGTERANYDNYLTHCIFLCALFGLHKAMTPAPLSCLSFTYPVQCPIAHLYPQGQSHQEASRSPHRLIILSPKSLFPLTFSGQAEVLDFSLKRKTETTSNGPSPAWKWIHRRLEYQKRPSLSSSKFPHKCLFISGLFGLEGRTKSHFSLYPCT